MTSVAPSGSGQAPSAQGESTSPSSLSWEGDKMFNIYIYDYCYKRGFRKTASELLTEAEIPPDSSPPINAKQGLLFEWWSVFWVLFTAKASGNGTDEAMLYIQHQQQAAQRQAAQRLQQQPQAQMGQPQPPMQHQQPPMNRLINGMPPRAGFIPNGPIPNGVGPAGLTQGPMQPGGPASFAIGAPGAQQNGISGPPGVPPVPGAPSSQPQNFQPLLHGQRPSLTGPQQRGPNPPPFQSPTMAHSPQNTGATSGQPQPQQQHSQMPMAQLGPSPHLAHMNRGGMPPPNGPQGMSNPGQQANTPSSSFQQLGRPPSRTATPGPGGMMPHPSPSMAARQTPGGMMSGTDLRQAQELEISRLPAHILAALRADLGLADKDSNTFTPDDKQRIINLYRQRTRTKPGAQGANNATAGPSNPMMQPPNQRNPSQQQRGSKRSSTSPGEDPDGLPRTESSPPDRKRVRRSPMGMEQPLTPTLYPHPPSQQQPGGPGGQQQQQQQPMGNGMMRPMGPMNGFPLPPGMPQMGNPMNMAPVMGVAQMGNVMSPAMAHPSHIQMMREAQYRQTLQTMSKGNMPQGGMSTSSGNAGSPPSTDSFNLGAPPGGQGQGQGGGPQFNPGGGPNSRMGQNKPMMMPPPSPAVSGPPKDQNGSNKDKNPKQSNGHPEGSPRNPSNSGQTPNAGGTAPPTPGPGGANQNQQNQNQSQSQNMAPSPSLGGNPPTMNPASSMGQQPQPQQPTSGPSEMFFPSDFIHNIASTLDEFDTVFKPDGDINFERDFGQWFNPDDVSGLELK